MRTKRWLRMHPGSVARSAARSERGLTMVEVLIAVVIVALITGALARAFESGVTTTATIGQRVLKTDDAQRLHTSWNRDVQSVDLAGVNPTGGTCGSGGTTVITLRSIVDGGTGATNTTTTQTWAVTTSGGKSRLVRRTCADANLSTPTATGLIAADLIGSTATASCTTATCTISLSGSYSYTLTVNRRVQPVGTASPSSSGSNLYAISNVPGSAQVWTVGLNCGLYYYGGTGSTATRVSLNTSLCNGRNLYGIVVAGTSGTYSVFAVGQGGLILRCNQSGSVNCTTASNWVSIASPTTNTLYAVTADVIAGTGSNTGRVVTGLIAVGTNGTVIMCKGSSPNCSGAAPWTQVSTSGANADLAGQTFTSVSATSTANAGPTSSDEKTTVLITARGTAPGDATKGRLLRCQNKCFSSTSTAWSYATSIVNSGSGQLAAVSGFPNAGSGMPAYYLLAGDGGRVLTCYNCTNLTLLGSVYSQILVATAVTDGSATGGPAGTLAVGSAGQILSCESTLDTSTCRNGIAQRTTFSAFPIFGATRTNTSTVYLVGTGGIVKVSNINNALQATCTSSTTPIRCDVITLP